MAKIINFNDAGYWNKLREEAKMQSPEELDTRIKHYEDLSRYLVIFRLPIHLYELSFGKGITLDQYEVSQQVLYKKELSEMIN